MYMRKLKIDQSKCSMCGACLSAGALVHELSDGTVEVAGSGVIQGESEQVAENLVSICPEKAISIENYSIDVNDLKAKIRKPLDLKMPDRSKYSFNKSDYSLPVMSGRGEYQYKYSSDDRAESAGLSDFRDNIWGQRKAIAQQVIISYKHDKLLAIAQYSEEAGNYKYETIQTLVDKLKNYVEELESATGRKISLPSDFYEFKTRDSVVLKDILKYGVDDGWAERIANECENYSWFDTWIDSDYTTRMKRVHRWFGEDDYEDEDVYCYKLAGASKKLNGQILDECQSCIPDMIDQHIIGELKYFVDGITKEWNEKTKILIQSF